jgi:NAD(P)-dependent dehydrogenase (short-subunit alcohol dehydrogenase family)
MSHARSSARDGEEVWIIGASQGLGLAMADLYSRKGARVTGMSRTPPKETAAFDAYVTIDLQSQDSVDRTIRSLYEAKGSPKTIFCCAATVYQGSILDRSERELRSEIETNYLGFVRLSRAIALFKPKAQRVRLVAVGSTLGYVGCPSTDNYSASKAALICFARSARVELEPAGIDISILSPPHMTNAIANGVDLIGPQPFPVEWAAKRMIAAARRGRREHLLGASNRFLLHMRKFAPETAQGIMNAIGRGALKRAERRV